MSVTYKGKRPEQGWSLHMSGGWAAQLERVRRWHARLADTEARTLSQVANLTAMADGKLTNHC